MTLRVGLGDAAVYVEARGHRRGEREWDPAARRG